MEAFLPSDKAHLYYAIGSDQTTGTSVMHLFDVEWVYERATVGMRCITV